MSFPILPRLRVVRTIQVDYPSSESVGLGLCLVWQPPRCITADFVRPLLFAARDLP